MEVHDGLAGRLPAVHANVKANRRVSLLNPSLRPVDDRGQRDLFRRRQREPIRAQPIRNDEQVAGRDRKAVLDDEEVIRPEEDPLGGKFEEHAHARKCSGGRIYWKPLLAAMVMSGTKVSR